MKVLLARSGKLVLAAAVVALVAFVLVRAVGAQGPGARISMISDWSHRHVIFSRPASWVMAWKLQGKLAIGNRFSAATAEGASRLSLNWSGGDLVSQVSTGTRHNERSLSREIGVNR